MVVVNNDVITLVTKASSVAHSALKRTYEGAEVEVDVDNVVVVVDVVDVVLGGPIGSKGVGTTTVGATGGFGLDGIFGFAGSEETVLVCPVIRDISSLYPARLRR